MKHHIYICFVLFATLPWAFGQEASQIQLRPDVHYIDLWGKDVSADLSPFTFIGFSPLRTPNNAFRMARIYDTAEQAEDHYQDLLRQGFARAILHIAPSIPPNGVPAPYSTALDPVILQDEHVRVEGIEVTANTANTLSPWVIQVLAAEDQGCTHQPREALAKELERKQTARETAWTLDFTVVSFEELSGECKHRVISKASYPTRDEAASAAASELPHNTPHTYVNMSRYYPVVLDPSTEHYLLRAHPEVMIPETLPDTYNAEHSAPLGDGSSDIVVDPKVQTLINNTIRNK